MRRGVEVNSTLTRMTDPSVYAVGDCAEYRRRTDGFVSPAWEQAGVLAVRRCGDDTVYEGSRIGLLTQLYDRRTVLCEGEPGRLLLPSRQTEDQPASCGLP